MRERCRGTLPWIGSCGIPSCITHRPLPTYQISSESEKLFVDGRMDVRTDRHLRPTLLGRLFGVDLKSTSNQKLTGKLRMLKTKTQLSISASKTGKQINI